MSIRFPIFGLFTLIVVLLGVPLEAKTLRIPPIYPEEAAEECIEGNVLLRFRVGDDGFAVDIEIIESEPPGIFDEASLKNVARWRFEVEGEEVRETTIEYRLEDCDRHAHNKEFKRTPASSRAAMPGEPSGGAG